jgi:TP901 family phage tail tape measure protein
MSIRRVLEVAVVLSAIDKMTAPIRDAAAQAAVAMGKLSTQTQKLSQQSMAFGRDAVGVGVGLAAAFALPIKAAMDFETGMTGVRKVVGELKDETAFKDFSQQVLQLGREIPLAYSELTDLVAAGGRMNVPKEQLIAYTKEVAKMATAFDMAAGDIGERMGKLAVAFEIPLKDIDGLADAINYLDDNSISKGKDIIEVLSRVAGTARQVGMSGQQAAALGSTFLTLGSSAEVAGTAATAMLRELSLATMQPAKFQDALGELGINAAQLQKQMSIDPQNTLLGVLDKLNKVKPEKQIEITTKLFGKEYGDDAAKLAKGVNEYRRQIELLSKTELKGSMSREFEARMKTSAAQATLFKNGITEIAITLGNALLPAFNAVIRAIKPYMDAFRDWAQRNPELVESIAKTVAITAALALGAGALSFAFGGVLKIVSMATAPFKALSFLMTNKLKIIEPLIKAFSLLKGILGIIGKAFTFLGGVVRAVSAIMMANPILAIITAIAIAAMLIYEYWEPIKQFFIDLWEGIKDVFWGFVEWITKLGQTFYDLGVYLMQSLKNGVKSMAFSIGETMFGGITAVVGDIATSIGYGEEMQQLTQAYNEFKQNEPAVFGRPDAQPNLPTPASGKGAIQSVRELMFSPNITINGNATPEQKKEAEGVVSKMYDDIMRRLKEDNRQQERKAFQ